MADDLVPTVYSIPTLCGIITICGIIIVSRIVTICVVRVVRDATHGPVDERLHQAHHPGASRLQHRGIQSLRRAPSTRSQEISGRGSLKQYQID